MYSDKKTKKNLKLMVTLTYTSFIIARWCWKEASNVYVMTVMSMTVWMNLFAQISPKTVTNVSLCYVTNVSPGWGHHHDHQQEYQCPRPHTLHFQNIILVFTKILLPSRDIGFHADQCITDCLVLNVHFRILHYVCSSSAIESIKKTESLFIFIDSLTSWH